MAALVAAYPEERLETLVRRGGIAAPREDGAPPPDAPAAPREELLGLLDRLAAAPEGAALRPAQLLEGLRRRLAQGPQGPRRLPPAEEGILEVGGQLLERLEADEALGPQSLPWLRRLELPLLKLALHDPGVLTDPRHPARRVVDELARLDPGAEGELALGALRREVEQALEALRRGSADPAALARTLEQVRRRLDALLRVHRQAFRANLAEVVSACEAGRPEVLAATGLAATGTGEAVAAGEPWRQRARRLRRDQWLLVDPGDGTAPRRLRLAWVSRDKDRFVLVDGKGLHALTLDLPGMAAALAQGRARPLEGAEEPPLERAQLRLLQDLHRRLLHATTHDPLTGLANRKEFQRRLRRALGDGAVRGDALVHLDLGALDTANALLGYEGTDRLLAQVARVLARELGEGELAGRIGSHEFGLFLRGCPPAEALDRTRALVETARRACRLWEGQQVGLSPRAGLVPVEPGECDAAALLQAAEAACRTAWEAGAPVQVFHQDDRRIQEHRRVVALLAQVDQALAEGRLGLRWQPIVPLLAGPAGGSLPLHGELLLAVRDAHGRPIPPQDFVLVAERYRRMPAIDRWVVSEALGWLARQGERAAALGTLGINLSGASVGDEAFLAFLLEEVERLRPPMERVCFEITETAGIASLSDAGQFIEEVKRTGCSFALDDFGSGQSSYAYLRELPVDLLKIDGSFVREMDRSPEDEAVVRSVTEIAHFLGKRVVAEHVERPEVLARLRELGVDYGQGYLLGRPCALERAVAEAPGTVAGAAPGRPAALSPAAP
ncbi:MAG: DUF1631 family protein [Gammaproteobacteria bacterium]|nr:MAG: DUF1631 family protein [Gammaproteobacteria bacterium]